MKATRVAPPRFVSDGPGRWIYRWFRWQFVFLVPFAAFWDVLVGAPIVLGGGSFGATAWGIFGPLACIGLAITYVTVALLVNRSTLVLDEDELRVTHGPLRWFDVSIPRSEIVRFDEVLGGDDQEPYVAVRAIRENGRKTQVLGQMAVEDAQYLASELERALTFRATAE